MLSDMDLNNLVLRPNCLMTKSPLVFIPGPKSLFFYKKPFSDLPRFLEEHGYQVIILNLPFRSVKLRRRVFTDWLKKNERKTFHFITDSVTALEFKAALPQNQSISLTTITESLGNEVNHSFIVEKKSAPLHYQLHSLFNKLYKTKICPYSETFSVLNRPDYERFLDHCVELAENEWELSP